jgi:myo-inositol-1(or 4)-monophosphatase
MWIWTDDDMMHYHKELQLIKKITKPIFEETTQKVFKSEFKGEQDIVTTTDLFIEKALVKAIKEAFPEDYFHTEEYHHDTHLKDRTWLIDPIDGTSNYAAHLELYVVQIALYDQGDIVLSYIYMPSLDNSYYAIKNQGAFLNDQLYQVDDHQQSSSFMMTLVGLTQDHQERQYYGPLMDLAIENKYKIRMLGSIGLELAFASEGVYDLLYTNISNYWDLFPGILLLRESKAMLFNEKGESYQINDKHLFVCKNEKSKEILFSKILKKADL